LALMRRSDLEASRPEEDRYAFEREGAAALYSVERKKGRARCEGYRLSRACVYPNYRLCHFPCMQATWLEVS
jgi:hypothetical protein